MDPRRGYDLALRNFESLLPKRDPYGNFETTAKTFARTFAPQGISAREIGETLFNIYSRYGPSPFGGNRKAAVAKTLSFAKKPGGLNLDSYLAKLNAQLAGLGAGGSGQVQAPSYDINAAFAKARKQAQAAVNPLYQKKLNDFLKKQAILRERQKTDVATATQDIEEGLTEALQTSQIARERTTEDVAQETSQLNTAEQEFQSDQGTAFDEARNILAGDVAASGLTTSGLGQQQIAQATQQRNVQEGRQVRSFNVQKEAQQQFKTRTFEDLLRRDTSAQKEATKGKQRLKIDLDRYLQDLKLEEKETRRSLEIARLGDISQQQGQYAKLNFNRFLATLRNPALIEAAQRTYGSSF